MIGSQVVHSLKWLTSGRLLGQAVTAVVSIVIVRLLTPDDYGLMAMAGVFLGLIFLLNEMGLGSALVQQKVLQQHEIEQVFGLLLVVNMALYLMAFLVAPLIAIFFKEPRAELIIKILALRLPLQCLSVVPRALLQRRMRFKVKSMADLVSLVSTSLSTLILAVLGYGVWALVYGVLIGGVIQVFATHLAARVLIRPRFSLRGMRHQVTFGGIVTLDYILWYVYTQADSAIVGRILGKEALGIYYVAKLVASMPLDRLGGIFTEVGFSAYSKVQHDRQLLRSHYCKAARVASFFGFSGCFGISAIAPEAVSVILGDKWLSAVLPLQLIALTIPLRQLNVLNTPALLGIGRPDLNVINLLFALTIMPAAFLVGSRWGLPGVATAWVLAYPVYFLIMLARSLPILGVPFNEYFASVWPSAVAAGAMYGVVGASAYGLSILGAPTLLALFLLIAIGILTYAGVSMLIQRPLVIEVLALVRR